MGNAQRTSFPEDEQLNLILSSITKDISGAAPPPPKPQKWKAVELRRSWRSLLPRIVIALAAGVMGMSLSEVSGLEAPVDLPLGQGGLPAEVPLFLVLFLFLSVRPLMLRFDTFSEIRRHHLVTTRGILSLRRQRTNIPYEDIRGVKVDQAIWERPLNCGTIVCWSVSADSPEIRIPGVAGVHRQAMLISERVDDARIERRNTDVYRR